VNRTVAVIQARTGSNRLPGKILELLDGEASLLAYQCRRLRNIAGVDELVIATTENPDDDVIVNIAKAEGVRVFRGSEQDVLSRFLLVAEKTLATTLVRITSDSPFRDPGVIATCVAEHHKHGSEYTRPAPDHLPKGMRAEVVETAVLRQLDADQHTTTRDREHVTVYIREHAQAFRTHRVEFPQALNHPDFDLSVDTPADLEFVRSIHSSLMARDWPADIEHICKMLEEVPVDETPLRGFA
jgi:spore coat polysaccharide biosynthesis protein SpsF